MTLQAAAKPERIAWSRTPEVLKGRPVLVELTSGASIEGLWISVTADTFTVRVEKTSARRTIGKGKQTLPRSSIQAMRTGNPGRWRVIGALAGFFGTMAVARAATGSPEALQGPWALALLPGTIAGYVVGREFDHYFTHEVVLLP